MPCSFFTSRHRPKSLGYAKQKGPSEIGISRRSPFGDTRVRRFIYPHRRPTACPLLPMHTALRKALELPFAAALTPHRDLSPYAAINFHTSFVCGPISFRHGWRSAGEDGWPDGGWRYRFGAPPSDRWRPPPRSVILSYVSRIVSLKRQKSRP